ncbi:hypothetical protein ACPXCG_00540 [Gordonia sp. DT218]|nr:hypothetical protein [Gordonia sp. SL306]WAC54820.1 hypothetical protein OVA31_19540 [Gordonia sp. SL306]
MSNDSNLFSHCTDTTHAAVQATTATSELQFSDAQDNPYSAGRD